MNLSMIESNPKVRNHWEVKDLGGQSMSPNELIT